jgi:hypothetical protein
MAGIKKFNQRPITINFSNVSAPLLEFLSCCAFKLYVEGGLSCPPHKSENLFYHAI